ncbi:transposase [Alkalibaculum sp. M08DMB]|uniref:Transposase n=1 Tax=Alkalibaculum sporogenes TaxID=2655001 RepID=A0A6A7KBF8_9FIRM|nr:transposase [Alkalibaculum sporogenes]MPW26890.1 transposase [Alkalibaculum sporogenes]
MSRQARKKSSTGIYHIMVRGINNENIFLEDEDKEKYIDLLRKMKEVTAINIYGYCIMDSHLHLLVKEGEEYIGDTMKRIGVSYVYWYNKKYKRKGHLFQDRYKSQVVENDIYLISLLRYIHQNPIKAKIVDKIEDYRWSSYNVYISKDKDNIVNKKKIITYFEGKSEKESIKEFKKFMIDKGTKFDYEEEKVIKITDEQLKSKIEEILQGNSLKDQSLDNRNKILREIKKNEDASIRQIARVTEISRNIIAKA